LVHCSDGWDSTPQLVATTQLLLDPFYRTLNGFATLVEKDWRAFGHKFYTRCQQAGSDFNSSESSPIFLQWLDVVYQIMRQFPEQFEFKANMLLAIADALYSQWFGTFATNSEREAIHKDRSNRHLWDYLRAHFLSRFVNPAYPAPIRTAGTMIALLDVDPQAVVFWRDFFLRSHQPAKAVRAKKIVRIRHSDTKDDEQQITALGFPSFAVQQALEDSGGDVKAAIKQLLIQEQAIAGNRAGNRKSSGWNKELHC